MSFVKEWILSDPDKKVQFEDYFGKTYSRDELIDMITNDSDMERELNIRVISKWEEIEDSIRTNRRGKYE